MVDEEQPRRRFLKFWRYLRFRPSTFALRCVSIYVSVAALSVIAAHILLITRPQSGLAERIIAPVARGIEFVDAHWKAVLILVSPFAMPVARSLIPRLRKAWSFEFDPEPLPLETEGVREKPKHNAQGERQ